MAPAPAARRAAITHVAVAAALLLASAGAEARNGTCLFRTNGTMTMGFGTINPSATTNVVASITTGNVAQIGDCRGVTMAVTADDGSNFSGSRRMANAARTDFIPYALTLPANRTGPGNNNYVDLVITGTVTPAGFQNARAGAYTDRVVITVSP
ncbi:MAG TPA: spore coat protein U domain-containing protein [Ramlibacter sp.]|uniref:spore coat protein U domain-containing protein n=1 Tax=Ramlibacter sp. TaxID=1917967 RepID=UPI002D2B506F|nr:spore coat protein U domain-containing protein [Ramlibacter sp.]HZY19762.1 spore coat protein U domain-containing protein [Ramlibacter sp.]